MYSSTSLRRKRPRKLDRLKCENCRQAKKKCIANELGCARCRDKGVDCPGRTKAGAFSNGPSCSPQAGDTRPLSFSFVASQNEWQNSSGINDSNRVELNAVPVEESQTQQHSTSSDSLSDQIAYATEEIDGLETGMDFMDSFWNDNDIDEDLSTETTAHQSFAVSEPGFSWLMPLIENFEEREPVRRYIYYDSLGDSIVFKDFKDWVSQIQTRCDGYFVCINPRCKLQSFEASWKALIDHHNNHVSAYEYHRLDYNMIKSHFPRQYEATNQRLQQAAMSRNTWYSWTVKEQHTQLALDMQRFKHKASGCDKAISQTRQFQDLRMLKKAFRVRYADFLRTSVSSPELSEFAAMLQSTYRNSRGLHRLGFGVFRKVLAGTAPTTVLEVFAFELLSGAMTNVLQNVWNKDIPQEPRDIDYLVWRSAIGDDSGKDLFDHLMNNWFPHFRLLQDGMSSLGHLSHETMRDYILRLVLSRKSTEPPNFSAFSSSELTAHIHGTSTGTYGMDRGSFDPLCDIKAPPWQGEVLQVGPKSMTVRDSIVFTGAYLFMIFVTERGILVIYLGNPDRRCKSLGFEATAGNILQVSEQLKSKVIDPLLTAFSDAPLFSWLLESAKAMVDCGQTWSVEELHHVLQWTVKGAVQDLVLQSQWQTVIDLKCQLAQDSIAPAYGR